MEDKEMQQEIINEIVPSDQNNVVMEGTDYDALIKECENKLERMHEQAEAKVKRAVDQLIADMERDSMAMLTANGVSYCMDIWMRHFPEEKTNAYVVGINIAADVSNKLTELVEKTKELGDPKAIEDAIDNSYNRNVVEADLTLKDFVLEVVWLQFVKKHGNAAVDIVGFVDAAKDEERKVQEQIEEFEEDKREAEEKAES